MASNVCIKLNTARMLMQQKGLKQNGVNGYANYKYFELADILPASNEICHQIGATIYTQFDDKAHLFFVDNETGDKIEFTLPMSTASLKGCHEVQNLGAVQTYLKRYLYQNCYELSESDALDMTMNPNEQKNKYEEVRLPRGEATMAEASDKIKAEAELVVKKFEVLTSEKYIKDASYKAMVAAYGTLKTENDYRQFIANCKKNIQAAEQRKAEGVPDDEIPF